MTLGELPPLLKRIMLYYLATCTIVVIIVQGWLLYSVAGTPGWEKYGIVATAVAGLWIIWYKIVPTMLHLYFSLREDK